MIDILVKNIPGFLFAIFTSCITAYLTAKWSLKRYYSEKWWERKEKAYEEIIDALYDILQYCEIQKEDYGSGIGYSDDKMKELGERYSQAYWKIKKTTDIGAFVVSHEAEKILIELHNRPRLDWDDNPSWEIFAQDYTYYREALTRIVEVAKKDFKTSRA